MIWLLLAACGVPDPKAAPSAPTSPPDEQFLVWTDTHDDRVLVWNCVDGARVVMVHECGEMACQRDWWVKRGECGQTETPPVPDGERRPLRPPFEWSR